MGYQNAENILPEKLLEEIQNYVCGECLYIPQRRGQKQSWGTKNGTKQQLEERNREIYECYQNGMAVKAISKEYFLSEKSIYRIISNVKNV